VAGVRRDDSIGVEAKVTKDRVFRENYGDFLKISYVRVFQREEGFLAEPLEADTTDVGIFVEANGFFVASEEILRVSKGESVLVQFLPGFSLPGSTFFPDLPYST
jgi:molybdopterin biosynthesis enzyme